MLNPDAKSKVLCASESKNNYMQDIFIATRLAAEAHKNQRRKTDKTPYISHPYSVAMLLEILGFPEVSVIAGILHDTVEDTTLTYKVIEDSLNCGEEVSEIVKQLTENKNLSWEDRKFEYKIIFSKFS